MMQMTRVAVALGSSRGDREVLLKAAADKLREDLLQHAVASSVYETKPWGGIALARFLNAVIVGDTDWKPPAIVTFLKQLEKDLGRTESERYADREIDLDLLVYGDKTWESDGVIVPHPGLADRDFVLIPLAEVWPDWIHPRKELSVRELRRALPNESTAPVLTGIRL